MKLALSNAKLPTIVFLLNTYITVLLLNRYSGIEALIYLGHIVIAILIIFAIVGLFRKGKIKLDKSIGLSVIATLSILATLAFIQKGTQIAETIKIASVFIFYLAGRQIYSKCGTDTLTLPKISSAYFLAIPMAACALEYLLSFNSTSISIFANRNNAVLFAVVSSALLTLQNTNKNLVTYYVLACTLLFKTLGALLAAVVAIAASNLEPKRLLWISLTLIPTLTLIMVFKEHIPILERLANTLMGARDIFSGNIIEDTRNTSYAEAVLITGSTDISYFFRIKHWIELLDLYFSGSYINMIFGYGVNSSPHMTSLNLLPHNDYLRFLIELGFIPTFCFLFLNATLALNLRKTAVAVPCIFLTLYFFTENIINNFTVMAFYYYLAGALISAQQNDKKYANS